MPIIYKSIRIGKNGKPFYLYKLRTMIEGSDKDQFSAGEDDPRVTKAGRILRKYKLDELPQLINVLKGEMALVGPRPEVPKFIEKMTQRERDIILSVKPGITDLASLWNFDEGVILKGSKDPDKDYEEKIWPEKKKLQIEYIKNRTFLLDVQILWKTVGRLLKR